jgi:hypothetical protein
MVLSAALLVTKAPILAQLQQDDMAFMSHIVDSVAAQTNVLIGSKDVLDDPGTLVHYRTPDNLGKSFDFRITGEIGGQVWGSDIYTDDSHLATAAVHAGVVRPGETGIVRVTILPGRKTFRRENRNGILSSSYGPWFGAYMIDSVDDVAPADNIVDAPNNLMGVGGEIGDSFMYRATGSKEGHVWGSDIYTCDSSIAAAAVHSGVLEHGQTGLLQVTILPGRTSYHGLERHGVSSHSWGEFPRSFMVDRPNSTGADPFESDLLESATQDDPFVQ